MLADHFAAVEGQGRHWDRPWISAGSEPQLCALVPCADQPQRLAASRAGAEGQDHLWAKGGELAQCGARELDGLFLPDDNHIRRCIIYHCLVIGLLTVYSTKVYNYPWLLRLTSAGRIILFLAFMRTLLPLRLPSRIQAPNQAATAHTIRPALALVLNSAGRHPLCARRPASSSSALNSCLVAQNQPLPPLQARGLTTSARLLRPLVGRPESQPVKMAPYEETLKGKYPGKLHAKRVAEYIRSKLPNATSGVIYLEGGKTRMIENCDQEEHFR